MRHLRAWLLRCAGLFRQEQGSRDFADEIESHLQMHIADNLRSGMTPQEARRQALIKLGGVQQTREQYRNRASLPMLEMLWSDIRFGARVLWKSRGFSIVAKRLDVETDGEALLRSCDIDHRGTQHAVEHGIRMVQRRSTTVKPMQ